MPEKAAMASKTAAGKAADRGRTYFFTAKPPSFLILMARAYHDVGVKTKEVQYRQCGKSKWERARFFNHALSWACRSTYSGFGRFESHLDRRRRACPGDPEN